MEVVDISMPLIEGRTSYPSVLPLRVTWPRMLERGDTVSLSDLGLISHLGTHVDAPAHVLVGGQVIDGLDLARLIGPADVLDLSGVNPIGAADLQTCLGQQPAAAIILIRTGYVNCMLTGGPFQPYPHMDEQAAEFLVRRGAVTIGVDTPSVDRYGDKTMKVHKALLGAGVVVAENLHLEHVRPGRYRFIGLPLSLRGVEAAPMRAVLLKE